MFTMRPYFLSIIPGSAACVQRNVLVAFTAKIRFHSSSVVLASGAEVDAPALFTRMSTLPNPFRAASIISRMLAGSVTSAGNAFASAPSLVSSAAIFSTCSAVRAATKIRAPSRARERAMAAPIPRPPPVTTATCPPRLMSTVHGKQPGRSSGHLCQNGFRQDFPQDRNRAPALFHRSVGRSSEVGERTPGLRERLLVLANRDRKRRRILGKENAQRLANSIGTVSHDDRGFKSS